MLKWTSSSSSDPGMFPPSPDCLGLLFLLEPSSYASWESPPRLVPYLSLSLDPLRSGTLLCSLVEKGVVQTGFL